MSSPSLQRAPLALCLVALLATTTAIARPQGTPPDYGFDWATITHPGNRAANAQEAPDLYNPNVTPTPILRGAVNHEYRITKTEVTTGQYLDFINAWSPYMQEAAGTLRTGSRFLTFTAVPRPGGGFYDHFSIIPGAENVAVDPSLKFAMLMSNWLHNGKQTSRDSFVNGAYDLRNVPTNASGGWLAVPSRLPGAKYWVPSIDEWIKAGYYDPNRYGTDQGGYWAYPNASNTQPVPGLPGVGGTDSGLISGPILNAGSYPNTRSTWGLLDVVGGWTEWTDTPQVASFGNYVGEARFGGQQGVPYPANAGRLDEIFGGGLVSLDSFGFRLASIPSPTASLLLLPLFLTRRR